MAEMQAQPVALSYNEEKKLIREVNGIAYNRYAIRTHVIQYGDDLVEVTKQYTQGLLQPGDIFFITEKAVACTQQRAIPMADIHPRPLAKFLCKFVKKTPYGIGLGIPETMEMALRECGTLRILLAAFVSAIGKLFGQHGWFYKVAGTKARAIDGPCDCTLPPYNHYVVLSPAEPEKVAERVSKALGVPTLITDINDLGADILGAYPPDIDCALMTEILRDNPLGQSHEQTPFGIIRKTQMQTA